MSFNDIEAVVKSKFKDIKKHAEEITYEIEVHPEYLRKAKQHERLEFSLDLTLNSIESIVEDIQAAKPSANRDSVTVKGKAPNTLYIKRRSLTKRKPEILGGNIDKDEESLQKAKEIAGERTSEYFNKAMN